MLLKWRDPFRICFSPLNGGWRETRSNLATRYSQLLDIPSRTGNAFPSADQVQIYIHTHTHNNVETRKTQLYSSSFASLSSSSAIFLDFHCRSQLSSTLFGRKRKSSSRFDCKCGLTLSINRVSSYKSKRWNFYEISTHQLVILINMDFCLKFRRWDEMQENINFTHEDIKYRDIKITWLKSFLKNERGRNFNGTRIYPNFLILISPMFSLVSPADFVSGYTAGWLHNVDQYVCLFSI